MLFINKMVKMNVKVLMGIIKNYQLMKKALAKNINFNNIYMKILKKEDFH